MIKKYNHKAVEKRWQKFWQSKKIFKASEDSNKPKQYILDMFPYPSGAGLHVGHPKGYIATDVVSRMRMMQGYNVLHPMGWDAFGLPAENYAIKNKVHPSVATAKNVQTFKKQLGLLGFTYDWSREINTTDPNYYKWTQWIFLQMFKRGLAYESNEPINWCPSCKTGLANEDLEDGKCERCGSVVEQKPLRQWVLKITDYAERLLNDLDIKIETPIPHVIDKKNPPMPGKKTVERKTIHAIVRDPKTGRFLCLNWKNHNWTTFIVGGIEDNEEVVSAAKREVLEETGYDDLKLVKILGGQIKAEYYAAHKDENRIANTTGILFELNSDRRVSVAAEEVAKHEVIWLDKSEITEERMTCAELSFWLGQLDSTSNFDDHQSRPLLDWPESIKEMQRNWIGRSEGINFKHKVKDLGIEFECYDSIPQTFLAQTFVVIAPEHPLVEELVKGTDREKSVMGFVEKIKAKKVSKKFDIETDMEGIFTGRYSENYMGIGRDLPIWVASFALMDYGTGIVGCSAHDERDWKFAKKYDLPLRPVLFPVDKELAEKVRKQEIFYREPDGILEEPKKFAGMRWDEAREPIINYIVENCWGRKTVNYKLRDWVFSRQRYWGEPIPLVRCERCGGKKPKILYIHGIYGDSQENWVPWFRKEMESRGYEVLTPDLPNNVHPTMECWLEALSKLDIKDTDRLFIVGHSLGCPVACQFVLKRGVKVEKLILVGPTGKSQGEVNWENLHKAGCDEESLNCIRKFNNANKNLDKVKKLVEETVIYLSDNDPYIPMTVKSDYKAIGAKVIVLKNKGHFNKSAGILEFPDLLKDFPAVKRQRVLLIHGFTGRADKNWMPFMKENLEKIGFEVFVPTMTTSEHPVLEKWMEELMPIMKDFNENDVVIGHSLGGNAALHLLERLNKKIGHLFLVAPAVSELRDEDIQKKILKKPEKDYWSTKNFWNAKIYWDKIIDNVETATVIYSDNDESVKSCGYEFWPQDWEIKRPGAYGHFTDQGYSVLFDIIKASRANGWIPLPESDLPLELPKVKHYEPSGTGESPLANIDKWVNTKCPVCGGPAKRETNTMPQWAGSCWYYLRYCDPNNNKNLLNTGFVHKPAIEATEKDKLYFSVFKKVYTDLENRGVMTWAGNRLMLNGINHDLWVPLRTVCLLLWNKDVKTAVEYLQKQGYSLIQDLGGNVMFEKDGVKVELVPVYKDKKGVYSLSYNKVKQPMKEEDLSAQAIGHLWGFDYRVVSPEYNLWHLKYVQKHEPEHRVGVEDNERIEFLESWVKATNKKILYWNPVDLYVGGAEHATRHLIYARFWHKFLYDIGAVGNTEPFTRLQNVGLILAEDGRKMSKRWGNVINPDDVVREYGADAMRLYEMFMGPFDQPCAWSMQGLVGMRRFLERVWHLQTSVIASDEAKQSKSPDNKIAASADANRLPRNDSVTALLHQTIKKVTEDIDGLRFNTAISQLMTLVNEMTKDTEHVSRNTYQTLLQLLSPFAPHIAEELWSQLGNKTSITKAEWPKYDQELAKEDKITIAVQINGKLRDTFEVPVEIGEEEVKKMALASEKVQKWLEGKAPKKVIYVKGKLVSIVV